MFGFGEKVAVKHDVLNDKQYWQLVVNYNGVKISANAQTKTKKINGIYSQLYYDKPNKTDYRNVYVVLSPSLCNLSLLMTVTHIQEPVLSRLAKQILIFLGNYSHFVP